jgi:hypothetical protein
MVSLICALSVGMAVGMTLGICLSRYALESGLRRAGLLRADEDLPGERGLRWHGTRPPDDAEVPSFSGAYKS